MKFFSRKLKSKDSHKTLGDFFDVHTVEEEGFLFSETKRGFMLEMEGLDGSFLEPHQLNSLHNKWRGILNISSKEEIQVVFRKRVEFSDWVTQQLGQSFLADNAYGRRLLLDRLAEQLSAMSEEEPQLLSQKIILTFWTREELSSLELKEKRLSTASHFSAFGFRVLPLDRKQIEREINCSAQDLESSDSQEPEWPSIQIEGAQLQINSDIFRSLELNKLPENFTELGMIQSITSLPYPIDVSLRLTGRDAQPISKRLVRKRNMLNAQRASKNAPSADLETQMDQIDSVLRSIAESSESILDMRLVIGLRFPKELAAFLRKAMAVIIRSATQMDFCELDESTVGTFDSYLECIPGFTGKNIRSHTVLASNALHFLPFFRPAKGDARPIASFRTRNATLYGLDPVDSKLANYNWLVSGTSGAGKSFFVNSLLAQSASISPNIFIVDIGGSYNKLTQFLGGRVMSLETTQGFELSPFFLAKSNDPKEEKMRRQHIYQVFLEMTRVDGALPPIEIRHLLSKSLDELFELEALPKHPISELIRIVLKTQSTESQRLSMLLHPWRKDSFFGQFLDNNKVTSLNDRILTFDLKGLTEFEELSRVVQLIVCASLWARIRQCAKERFSWIVLDEVAFSLLKTQPQFVDELVATLRKYFAGAIIVVQDLEKVTSNLAGSGILQNTQSKIILQQRGDPKNYSEALSLNQVDLWAIESLRREKGVFSEAFLIRDSEKAIIRHMPSELEYWLATTAPEDAKTFEKIVSEGEGSFQKKILDFAVRPRGAQL